MRQIVIDERVRKMSELYLSIISKRGVGRYQTPEERLKDFEEELTNTYHLPDYAKYIKKIRDLYPIIIRLKPNCFDWFYDRYFRDLSQNIDLSLQITRGSTKLKFYEWVSSRMRYDDVRTSWLLPFMKQLDIKTCCYCNAQYATTFIGDDGKMASYDLDHFYPQSKYPYLSTSFFNLVPSCSCCNRHKSNHDEFHYPLYVTKHQRLIRLALKPDSIIKYWMTTDADALKIDLKDGVDAPTGFADAYDKVFYIRDLYTAHTDEAEEILWKSRIYNESYKLQLENSFSKLFANDPDKSLRFYLGFYSKESDILKRPLSKLKQDIARQVGLI